MPVVLNPITENDNSLITLSQLTTAIPNLSAAQLADAPAAIVAASIAINQWTKNIFVLTDYDEIYSPSVTDGRLILKHFPVNTVYRVSSGKTQAAAVFNFATTLNQRAYMAFSYTGDVASGLTYTGLNLTRVSSAVSTTVNLLFSTYLTIQSLVDAINALGSGWDATVTTGMGQWPTTELTGGEASQGCMGGTGACLAVFAQDIAYTSLDQPTGVINIVYPQFTNFLYQNSGSLIEYFDGELPGQGVIPSLSPRQVRVAYNSGYATIPADVQRACILAVNNILNFSQQDITLLKEDVRNHKIEFNTKGMILTKTVKQILSPYKDWRV